VASLGNLLNVLYVLNTVLINMQWFLDSNLTDEGHVDCN
jgi:hypothetical protein